MYADIRGKYAVVTGAGAASGIGFAIAEELAKNGAHVVLADLPACATSTPQMLMQHNATRLEHRWKVRTKMVPLDVTSDASVAAFAEETLAFGPVSILVNNAGVNLSPACVADYDPQQWMRVVDINLFGTFRVLQALLPHMGPGSSIVNIASRAGKRPAPTWSAYSASKAGMIMLTKNVAVEYASKGIRSNALCPGLIMTDLQRQRILWDAVEMGITPEERTLQMEESIPLRFLGTPQHVSTAAAFLASEASSYMTGQAINVTGGLLMEV